MWPFRRKKKKDEPGACERYKAFVESTLEPEEEVDHASPFAEVEREVAPEANMSKPEPATSGWAKPGEPGHEVQQAMATAKLVNSMDGAGAVLIKGEPKKEQPMIRLGRTGRSRGLGIPGMALAEYEAYLKALEADSEKAKVENSLDGLPEGVVEGSTLAIVYKASLKLLSEEVRQALYALDGMRAVKAVALKLARYQLAPWWKRWWLRSSFKLSTAEVLELARAEQLQTFNESSYKYATGKGLEDL